WKHVTRGIGDGILDEGGFPYRLTNLSNTTNTGLLRPSNVTGEASAILNGFYHRIDEPVTLEFPAVTSQTTYYVVLLYNPLDAVMPVSARVVTALDTSQGKSYLLLHKVVRSRDQLLTDADVQMVRPRVAPVQVYAYEEHMPPANTVLWGTLAIAHNGRAHNNAVLKMAMTGDDAESVNGWYWKTVYDPNANEFEWTDIPDTSTYVNPGSG